MNNTEPKQEAHASNEDIQATTNEETQITDDEFSKLSYRQKFAITEYEYLLSPEDAEELGKMLRSFAKEKDILSFCQEKGKKIDRSQIATKTNPLLIKVGDFFRGLLGWVIIHNVLFLFLLLLIGFIFTLPISGNSVNFVYFISLAIWLAAAVVIRTALIRKRVWIFSGVVTALIVNAICWVVNCRDWPLGEIIMATGLPFPIGAILLI